MSPLSVLAVLCSVASGSLDGSRGVALTQKAFANVKNYKGELVVPWKGTTPRDLHQECKRRRSVPVLSYSS